MLQSGVAQRQGVDMDFEDDQDSKVHVLVHDLKPPFLDGTIAYTKQLEPINPVRDGTSDLAVFSKKGSALVKERRERQEREKVGIPLRVVATANSDLQAAAKAASVAGTTLGNLMGVKDEPDLGEGESSRTLLFKLLIQTRGSKGRREELQGGFAILQAP